MVVERECSYHCAQLSVFKNTVVHHHNFKLKCIQSRRLMTSNSSFLKMRGQNNFLGISFTTLNTTTDEHYKFHADTVLPRSQHIVPLTT